MKNSNTSDDAVIEKHDPESAHYPIRTVATLTGINPITLRAWERRYNLLKPLRTAKGHRLYSQRDIDLIYQVTDLLDKGIPISQVPQALLQRDKQLATQNVPLTSSVWAQYQQRMLIAISRFDEYELNQVYNEVLSLHPIENATYLLFVPLLNLLGQRWQTAEGSVAEEHFFSVFFRSKLGARFHHRPPLKHCLRLVGACLANENHEIGLMLFALAAHAMNYEMVVLGADTPLGDLPLVVKRSRSQALVLSSTMLPPMRMLQRELPQLVSRVKVPVFIGGQTSVACRDEIIRAGAMPLGDDIQKGLKYVDQQLAPLWHGVS